MRRHIVAFRAARRGMGRGGTRALEEPKWGCVWSILFPVGSILQSPSSTRTIRYPPRELSPSLPKVGPPNCLVFSRTGMGLTRQQTCRCRRTPSKNLTVSEICTIAIVREREWHETAWSRASRATKLGSLVRLTRTQTGWSAVALLFMTLRLHLMGPIILISYRAQVITT